MPLPHRTSESDLVLPSGFDDIVRVVDRHVVDRRTGVPTTHRRARHRLPALLFTRERPTGTTSEGPTTGGVTADDAGRGEPDPALSALVHVYHHRLVRLATDETGHLVSLAPHAIVDEDLLGCEPSGDDTGAQDGPHVRLLDRVARQLRTTMPDGSGTLRLPEFDVCLAVLRATIAAGDVAEERRSLRDHVYDKCARKFGFAAEVSAIGNELGAKRWSAIIKVFTTPLAFLWRWLYGRRIDRGRRFRWVGGMLDEPGRSFLNASMSLRDAQVRSRSQARADEGTTADAGAAASARSAASAMAARDEAVVRQVLLTALIHDLARAARPPVWSVRGPRRRWPFVLLLPTVGGEDSPSRRLLNSVAAVSEETAVCPLFVLGAATTDIPPYAAALPRPGIPGQGVRSGGPGATARAVGTLLAAGASGHPVEAVCTVPLSPVPDNMTGAERPVVQRPVRSREARGRDWLRPGVAGVVASAVAAALVAALVHVTGFTRTHHDPPAKPVSRATDTWCPRVGTGERVGLTDGSDRCDLAHGLYAHELRALERQLGRQNADVDRTEPYRTLVFFAPLSVGSTSRRTVPTGFQMLRGALLAQKQLNDLHLKTQMPIRLIVANAGEYFTFGSHGGLNTRNHSRVDVAHMIIDRVGRDHIAGVIGLAQSRPESLQAAAELYAQGILVLATGVSGQRMVLDSPVSYYQLSAPDERVARVLASFARRSPRLASLAKVTAGHTAPAAVLVFDPRDTYFSVDLKDRFTRAYGSAGPVYPVPYGEASKQSQTPSVAARVCALVSSTDGFILYAGRSSVMYDLFYYLQNDKQCHTHRGQIAVLAESPAPHLIQHPEVMAQQYDSLHLFYNQSGVPESRGSFAADFKKVYGVAVDSDAAGGYDAVKVYFRAMNDIMDTDPHFTPSAVVTYLQLTGLTDFVGESGITTFGKGRKYPLNKEVDIQEITSDGRTVNDLTCGAVEVRAAPVTRWGPSGDFICPPDD
ncbi:hypothetical protein [Streptomyces sp. NPDC096934]|uniref:ABC transporter substrate-binding protein n=1 Tax=Streptomyces sp. NPDC096934 TaxID=3155551 RepID=UPI00331D7663